MKKNKKLFIYILFALLVFGACAATIQASAVKVSAAGTSKKTTGWVTKSGVKYYYIKGVKQTGFKKIGKYYYFFDSKGRLVVNKHGYYIKAKKAYYKISAKGVLKKLSEVEGRAGAQVDALSKANKGVTDKKKLLKLAFNWSKNLQYRNVAKVKKNQAATYGLYGFKYKMGDCYVQAATFYWMAKSIGYSRMIYVEGTVPSTKGVKQPHGWVEYIGSNNKYYFYDPSAAAEGKAKVTYQFFYGTPGSLHYNDSHKHVVQYVAK